MRVAGPQASEAPEELQGYKRIVLSLRLAAEFFPEQNTMWRATWNSRRQRRMTKVLSKTDADEATASQF